LKRRLAAKDERLTVLLRQLDHSVRVIGGGVGFWELLFTCRSSSNSKTDGFVSSSSLSLSLSLANPPHTTSATITRIPQTMTLL
jgi:hypothetical protein